MSPEPVESTIKDVQLRQVGLTGKDFKNYLDKQFGPGTYDAVMIHNTYYFTTSSVVSLADVKKFAEEVEAAEAAEDTNTVTNEDNNAGGS